jgi:glycosyltransferase involved in cell wall biosynthesis
MAEKNMLTAIIPIGNVKGKLFSLPETLEDCKKLNVEVVIVHDNFHDGTAENLSRVIKGFENVRIFTGKFQSPGLARNLGLQYVTSEWFCFWDVDDVPNVPTIVEALRVNSGTEKNVIVGQYSIKNAVTGDIKRQFNPTENGEKLRDISLSPGLWRFIFRTNKYEKTMFGKGTMGEDQLFLARMNLSEDEIFLVEQDFYQYAINVSGQLTSEKYRIEELHHLILTEDALRTDNQNSKFIDYLILRQSFTLIKYRKSKIFHVIRPVVKSIWRVKFGILRFGLDIARGAK